MLDYLGIFKALNARKISYLVVGGTAVNLYGIPRMTYDLDILLDLEAGNLEKFASLVKGWGFKPKVPVDIMDLSDEAKRREWVERKHMKAFNLVNPEWGISEIDIVIAAPVDYPQAAKRGNRMDLQGVPVPVISLEDLIRMKRVANREQDKDDISYLKKVQDGRKKRRL
jgi:hypothetical protein